MYCAKMQHFLAPMLTATSALECVTGSGSGTRFPAARGFTMVLCECTERDRNPMTSALSVVCDDSATPRKNLFCLDSACVDPATASLVHNSIASSTRRAYRGALERLDQWLNGRALEDATLAGWITELHSRGLSASTASMAVAAARFRARLSGDDGCIGENMKKNPVGPMTRRTLSGIRRSSGGRGRGQVAGVLWEEADAVVDRAIGEGTLRGMRDAALIAVGSDALLRVSEMVAIDAGDIERDPDGSAVLHIRYSKTDQDGMGATCYLGCRTLEVLDAWMASAGIGQYGDEAVFRSIRKGGTVGGRLSDRSARSIVVHRCGRGDERVSGHSLRVGSALSLARAGASLVELQQAGRWKSPEMPARYTRGESARRGPVARLRHGQSGERRMDTGDMHAGSLADKAQNSAKNSAPGGGKIPGIRVNGIKAGIAAALREICWQTAFCLAVSPPLGHPHLPGTQESTARWERLSNSYSGSSPDDFGLPGMPLAAGIPSG